MAPPGTKDNPPLAPLATPRPPKRSALASVSLEAWLALGILVLTLSPYLQVTGFKFLTFDDNLYIVANPQIQEGLTWKTLSYALTTGDDGSHLPLLWLSHAACVSLFGSWAGGHHLVNVLLHGTNSVLLFFFLKRITHSTGRSAAVAILFSLHPLHVESVAWVSSRKDVLSTLFWILASWAYVRYAERPSLRRYLILVLLFILGLLSKSMLVTLPLTLLLLDLWPLGRLDGEGPSGGGKGESLLALVVEKIPLFALAGLTGLATLHSQQVGGATAQDVIPLPARLANALASVLHYLRQTIWPLDLSPFYPFHGFRFPGWQVGGSLAFIVTVSGTCLMNLRRRPYLAMGWFWYLITLLPVIGILQVGGQAHADRYTYVPLIGIFVMLSWLGAELLSRWGVPRWVRLVGGPALLGALITLTAAQVNVWRDNATLWKHAIAVDPKNAWAYICLGDEYMGGRHFQEALPLYVKAAQVAPNMYLGTFRTAWALEMMGRSAEALFLYQKAKQLRPELLSVDQKIGDVLVALGRFEEAVPYVRRVIEKRGLTWKEEDPVNVQASTIDWAVILASRQRNLEAVSVLETVLAQDPNAAQARIALGITLSKLGKFEAALQQMELALKSSPNHPQRLYYVGLALIQLKRFEDAQRAFDRIKEVEPQSELLQRGLVEMKRASELAEPPPLRTSRSGR